MVSLARRLTLVGAVCILGACVSRSPQPVFWRGFGDHPEGYLTDATAFDAAGFLPAAPGPASPQDVADRAVFQSSRKLEGGARWRQAAQDAEVETPEAPFKAFACALGVKIDPARAPTLTRLLGAALPDVERVQKNAKTKTFRARPFVAEPSPICIAAEPWLAKSSSYPSGHAAIGWLWGLTLSELAPDRQAAILQRAYAYGESRLICGVHYASDVEAGRLVGAGVYARLQGQARFRSDLIQARRELNALRRAGAAPDSCQTL